MMSGPPKQTDNTSGARAPAASDNTADALIDYVERAPAGVAGYGQRNLTGPGPANRMT